MLLLFVTVRFRYVMPVVLFSIYLLYGMIRPWISQKMRKEIEVETESDDEMTATAEPDDRSNPNA
jgi:CDP-diacylglycerol--serine O-phosphatidyltransferase